MEKLTIEERMALSNAVEQRIQLIRLNRAKDGFNSGLDYYEVKDEEEILTNLSVHPIIDYRTLPASAAATEGKK